FPNTLALDDARVYWVNRTDPDYGDPPSSAIVRSMPKRGGERVTLDTLRPGVGTSLHRHGSYLYFYHSIEWTITGTPFQGEVVRVCADGTCPRASLSGPTDDSGWEIALDDADIYFPTNKTGGLSKIDLGGSVPSAVGVFTSFFLSRFAVDDAYVYSIAVPN